MSSETISNYKKFAAQIRLETLKELGCLGFGHVGGARSIADTIAVLYGGVMKIDLLTRTGKIVIGWFARKGMRARRFTRRWRSEGTSPKTCC